MAKKRFFQESELVFEEKPKNTRFQDLTGQKFNRLTVLGFAGIEKEHNYWFCRCDCDSVTKVGAGHLKNGHTVSCGCFWVERIKEVKITHGHASGGKKTGTYITWKNMLSRCQNPKNKQFPDYGERGIQVCSMWQKFENFLEDMGDRPKGLTLERNEVNGNYCPENCRWATQKEQQNNRRNNRVLTFNDKTQTLAQWADELGINRRTLSYRISNSWPIEKALKI